MSTPLSSAGPDNAPTTATGTGPSTATDHIRDEVRELIRRRGIDPVTDPQAARDLVNEVTDVYEERAATSTLPTLIDRTETTREVYDTVAGYGPLQRFLDDPEIEEIWVNQPGTVFTARNGRSELTTTILGATEVRDLIERMLKPSGRRLDLSSPFVDALLPDGSRLHAVIPDITRAHVSLNIRKFVVAAHSLDDLVSRGSLTLHAARFLEAAVTVGLNIIVAGGTQAGKTTLLNTLINSIPAAERVVTCEEVFELRPQLPDVVAMQTRQPNLEGHGEIKLRRLIKEALRMRPSRIIVGEVRQEESLDLLIALNSGLPGMCSVHANSAREAVIKLCTLPLLAGENVTAGFVVPTVAASVDLIVHVGMDHTGARTVREIVALPGRVENGIVETTDIFTTQDNELVRAEGYPPHLERFVRHGIDLSELLTRREGERGRHAQAG
ncbi:CpaF family protein [Nakamurella silvestris]|nr:CpaF family protein [Nakamurella silvestris]